MSYVRCKTCGKWGFDDVHRCPPRWLVAPKSDPSNIYTVYAVDVEDAATTAAEEYDGEDYYLARGNEEEFVVCRDDGKNDFRLVAVEGETVPSYRARELGPAPEQDREDDHA